MKKWTYIRLLIILMCGPMLTSCSLLRKAEKKKQQKYTYYSQKLGYELTGKENLKLMEEVTDWLGVPYKYGGCSKSGVDCSCFVQSVYGNVYGIKIDRTTDEMLNSIRTVRKMKVKEGDLVFFKTSKKKKTNHVGIYLSKNKFAHASSSKGVTVSDLNDKYYQ